MYRKFVLFLCFIFIVGIAHSQGFKNRSIEYEGQNREYSIYVPMSYDGSKRFPLLFNFHGGNDRISNWINVADMRSLADTANFILVYPQARPDPSDGGSLNWLPKTDGTFDDVHCVIHYSFLLLICSIAMANNKIVPGQCAEYCASSS